MKLNLSHEASEILNLITKDRIRTNLLKNLEQKVLVFLVQKIPAWMTSNMLTFFGFVGSMLVFLGFILASYFHKTYLLLGIIGFAINWFGDSLDGRVAYYRHRSRRWYGFSLDLTVDWLTTILIGWGYIIYVNGVWEMLGYGFVAMYGWAIIITLIRYKVTGKYSIDSGLFGPTEVRIIICLILISEVLITNAIHFSAAAACILLFLVNIFDTYKLLSLADERDKEEKRT